MEIHYLGQFFKNESMHPCKVSSKTACEEGTVKTCVHIMSLYIQQRHWFFPISPWQSSKLGRYLTPELGMRHPQQGVQIFLDEAKSFRPFLHVSCGSLHWWCRVRYKTDVLFPSRVLKKFQGNCKTNAHVLQSFQGLFTPKLDLAPSWVEELSSFQM